VIAEVFTCRCATEFRQKNFEFNASGEGKPIESLYHKRRDVRKTGNTSNESSGGIEDSLDRR